MRGRLIAFAFLGLLWSAHANAAVFTMHHSTAYNGFQAFKHAVYGQQLAHNAAPGLSGTVQSFAFWINDPGPLGNPITIRTMIVLDSGMGHIAPADIIFQSPWQTLYPSTTGQHFIQTTVNVPVSFTGSNTLLFLIQAGNYLGPAWQLLTMGKMSAVNPFGGGANGPGMGVWVFGPDNLGVLTVGFGELTFDQDVALMIWIQSRRLIMADAVGFGAIASPVLWIRRRRWDE